MSLQLDFTLSFAVSPLNNTCLSLMSANTGDDMCCNLSAMDKGCVTDELFVLYPLILVFPRLTFTAHTSTPNLSTVGVSTIKGRSGSFTSRFEVERGKLNNMWV